MIIGYLIEIQLWNNSNSHNNYNNNVNDNNNNKLLVTNQR